MTLPSVLLSWTQAHAGDTSNIRDPHPRLNLESVYGCSVSATVRLCTCVRTRASSRAVFLNTRRPRHSTVYRLPGGQKRQSRRANYHARLEDRGYFNDRNTTHVYRIKTRQARRARKGKIPQLPTRGTPTSLA